MNENSSDSVEASPEQILYAGILQKGMLVGLILLVVTFCLYGLGVMKPYIPLEKLSSCWSMPVDEYLEQENIEAGWAWLGMLKYGDFLNFLGIALLAGISILCYMAIIPTLLKNNDKIYAVIAFVEVAVLVVAASGIFGSGGH